VHQLEKWREQAGVFRVCTEAAEVEEVMTRVGELARAKKLDVAVGYMCAEYRVYR